MAEPEAGDGTENEATKDDETHEDHDNERSVQGAAAKRTHDEYLDKF